MDVGGNVPLIKDHLVETDPDGNTFEFQFQKSFFAKCQLRKKIEWSEYRKVGQISEEGIDFVMEHVKGIEPDYYYNIDSFIKRISKKRKGHDLTHIVGY